MGRKAVSFLFYGISVVLTGLLLVAAVLCRYASSVSPGEGGFWATLALLMPVVLLANVVALVWWAVRRKWIVLLMPLVALVLNLGYISAMVQLPDFKERGNPHDIRIATLNVNGFRRLESTPATARAIAGMEPRAGRRALPAGVYGQQGISGRQHREGLRSADALFPA